ncbi:unnamed protein product [Peronospora belbahrii]|uniref:Uncharacterized protein n=1 Tax=Peronospora belbahrii TaxID=622444 RepID=A0ABN8DC90_9STRA|nr:unnamed protein product [Peronospora belbahrii]
MRIKKQRAFLDAAADGDLNGVNAWLASDPRGDVNVTLGEGWTALLYAVTHTVERTLCGGFWKKKTLN